MVRHFLPDLFRLSVSGTVAASASAASLYYWSGGDIDPLVMTLRAFGTEPWRLLTSSLPHGNWLHRSERHDHKPSYGGYWLDALTEVLRSLVETRPLMVQR